MLNVRLVAEPVFGLSRITPLEIFSASAMAPALLDFEGMNHTIRLNKLREKQLQIAAALREAEAEASARQRKDESRTDHIIGRAFSQMPAGEREALLPSLWPHMKERERVFVTNCLAKAPGSGQSSSTDN